MQLVRAGLALCPLDDRAAAIKALHAHTKAVQAGIHYSHALTHTFSFTALSMLSIAVTSTATPS